MVWFAYLLMAARVSDSRLLAVVILLAALAVPGEARQGALPGPASIGVYQLQLSSVPDVQHGKIAIVEGVADPSGQKLSLADLSVLQPVELSLFTPEIDDDVRIELSKFVLDEPARRGTTKGTAFTTFKFRTQGDLQIKVISPDGPNVYRLFVWVGDEVTPEMPAPFITMETYQKRMGSATAVNTEQPTAASGGGTAATPVVLWLIAGALAMIVLLLGIIVIRRKGA